MESYYPQLLPPELIFIILDYTEDYNSFNLLFNLSDLSIDNIKNYIFNNIRINMPEVENIVKIDFTHGKEILISSYIRTIKCYKESKNYLDHMINETNRIIKKYYPEANLYNLKDLQISHLDDILDDYLFEIRIEYVNTDIINIFMNDSSYEDIIKDYAREVKMYFLLLAGRWGIEIGLESDYELYNTINIDYNKMLMFMFMINYNMGITYIRDNSKY